MAPCSSGTLKSIRLRVGEARQRLAHLGAELATLEPGRPVRDEHPVLAAMRDRRLGPVGLDAHDLVPQAEAGAADARHPCSDLEDVVHPRWSQVLGLRA